MAHAPDRRPVADRLELAAPSVAAVAARTAGRLPARIRRRVLTGALARAEAAFNRGDFETVFALFTDDARYVPPPALSQTPIVGRAAILEFWRGIAGRYYASTIENISLEEVAPRGFARTIRITHRTDREPISYRIRQATELRRGRVISQVNEEVD
jgi:SnoaL-like domain